MPITISALNVYPVKGLKGIPLTEARCTDRGIEHDRRWMLVDREGMFFTQREHPQMATVWTEIDGDALSLSAPDAGEVRVPLRPEGGARVRVQVWNSTCDAITVSKEADEMLSSYLGLDCALVFMPDESTRYSNPEFGGQGKRVGFADGYAYLLTNEASLADLNAKLLAKDHPAVPMNRFRPNIVVAGATAYEEDAWGEIEFAPLGPLDSRLRGNDKKRGNDSALLRAVKPCGRCQVTTTDQTTGEVRGPEPLATLATYRDSKKFGVHFGMNLVTVREGTIRVGDTVEFG
jgi:uncharacterized protein YcbX